MREGALAPEYIVKIESEKGRRWGWKGEGKIRQKE